MKVSVKKVFELDGLGVFKKVEEWNGFTKYIEIGSSESFISISDSSDLFTDFSPTDDKEINIVSATLNITQKLKELRK